MNAIPSRSELDLKRIALVADPLGRLFAAIEAEAWTGKSTAMMERFVLRHLRRSALQSAIVGYRGFPAHCCISRNATITHGVPNSESFHRSDVFTVDVAVRRDGWCADSAWTFLLPEAPVRARRLVEAAWCATVAAARAVRSGNPLSAVSAAISSALIPFPETRVFPQFVGHGIGHELHEVPVIPFTDDGSSANPAHQVRFEPGMVVTVEPVLTDGSGEVAQDDDGWSFRTADGSPAALFELMIVVEGDRSRVLTLGGIDVRELPPDPAAAMARLERH